MRDQRPIKPMYYLEMARAVCKRSSCLRRHFGVVVVKNDEVVSTGYNGSPRGCENCTEKGTCLRQDLNIPRGQRPDLCVAVHAEANAIISASRNDLHGGTMYLYGREAVSGDIVHHADSCPNCRKLIINAGIDEVIYADPDGIGVDPSAGYGFRIKKVSEWIEANDILPPVDTTKPGY